MRFVPFFGGAASRWNVHGAYSGPTISNTSIPDGASRDPFSLQFFADAGGATVTWSATAALPEGMTLSSSGLFSGTPVAQGLYLVAIRATDSAGLSTDVTLPWTVAKGTKASWRRIARSASDAWRRIERT